MAGKVRKRQGRWSEEFKRRVVAEAAASDQSASAIARRHGLNPNLVFSWRKKFGAETHQGTTGKEVCLLPVKIEAAFEDTPVDSSRAASDYLEIDLPCGAKLRCSSGLDPELLGQALSELRQNTPGTMR